jgi:hypothetical protein
VSQYSKQHRVLGLCLSDVLAMLDIHDNLRLVDNILQRLVSLHTEVVRVQLQSCMSHKHGQGMRHCVCTGFPGRCKPTLCYHTTETRDIAYTVHMMYLITYAISVLTVSSMHTVVLVVHVTTV